MLEIGTRVRLIEVECGQDPECPIPTGTVVNVDEKDVAVRWDQPDLLPEVDIWPRERVEVLKEDQ